MKDLKNKSVAILATDGFEQSELFETLKALRDAGVTVKIISLKGGSIQGWDKRDWGKSIAVDLAVADANAADFDALVLPGGVMNPDKLRADATAVAFVREFGDAGKPIAAICHGPWTLINADLVQGRTLTSWPSLEADLTNAGAIWVDEECVVDQGLVTSRKPDDLPSFNRQFLEELAKGEQGSRRGVA